MIAGARATPPRILVVDDDDRVRTALRKVLEAWGLWVADAADGASALRLAIELQPDAILLDVAMPEMDGFDVCRALKRDLRTVAIPVLMLTGHAGEEELLAGFGAGAIDFVAKPYKAAELLARVNAHAQPRRLSGLLTVCCACFRIRNPAGVWQRSDQYLAEHTDAQISHGLCEACIDSAYPHDASS